jgi:replication fork protection complex subunit Csm3/Swi3
MGDNDEKGKDVTGKDGERKERKKIAKMDETKLVGHDGFPALIKTTKGFVPKGKGHEVLSQCLKRYTYVPILGYGRRQT